MQPQSPQYPLSASSSKSFIYNHRLSMSPCLHPTHITLNGYLSQYHYPHQNGPTPSSVLAPIFGICATAIHNDILTVAPEQFTEGVGADPLWSDKVDQRLLWRGRNTGVLHQSGNEWNLSQRIRLVEMGTRRGGETNVLLPRGSTASAGDGGTWNGAVGYGETVSTSALNAAFMDVAFVGKPIQCRDPVCAELQRMFEWRNYQSWQDAWVYKYIIDVKFRPATFSLCPGGADGRVGRRKWVECAVQAAHDLQFTYIQVHHLSRVVSLLYSSLLSRLLVYTLPLGTLNASCHGYTTFLSR